MLNIGILKKNVEKSVESELRRTVRGGVEIGKVMMNSAGWCSSHLSHVNGASGDTRW